MNRGVPIDIFFTISLKGKSNSENPIISIYVKKEFTGISGSPSFFD